MKQLTFKTREEWLEGRRGKITGSRLNAIAPSTTITKEMIVKYLEDKQIEFKKSATKDDLGALLPEGAMKDLKLAALLEPVAQPKIEYYRLISEYLAVPSNGENPMDRGHRCEPEALERFRQETGKDVVGGSDDFIIWTSDEDNRIAVSPDGIIGTEEAVEVKCLASEYHIQALIEQKIPNSHGEYRLQALQYFIVNQDLKTLYFVFYDPRTIKPHDFFYLEFSRGFLEKDIENYLEYQRRTLAQVEEIVTKLSF